MEQDQVQMWAPILADPLPGQAEIEVHSIYVDYDTMDFQALFQGPQDEHDLDRLLDGALNPTYIKEANSTHEIECNYSPSSDHGMSIQTLAPAPPEGLLEKEEAPATTALNGGEEEGRRKGGGARYPPPCHRRSRRLGLSVTPPEERSCDLLDCMPKCGWRFGSRVRSARKRGTWSLNTEPCSHDLRYASKGKQCGRRRNNDHWTSDEDKWRNLLKAYTVRPTSKKKGNPKRRISPPLDRDCVKKIQRLAADYPRK